MGCFQSTSKAKVSGVSFSPLGESPLAELKKPQEEDSLEDSKKRENDLGFSNKNEVFQPTISNKELDPSESPDEMNQSPQKRRREVKRSIFSTFRSSMINSQESNHSMQTTQQRFFRSFSNNEPAIQVVDSEIDQLIVISERKEFADSTAPSYEFSGESSPKLKASDLEDSSPLNSLAGQEPQTSPSTHHITDKELINLFRSNSSDPSFEDLDSKAETSFPLTFCKPTEREFKISRILLENPEYELINSHGMQGVGHILELRQRETLKTTYIYI